MKWLFWVSVAFASYTYVVYPLILFLLSRLFPCPIRRQECTPTITVVIAARNEERNIGKRLENLLEQDYTPERFEIIVVSDGSTDRTNEIVASFAQRNISLIYIVEKTGKAEALNRGVAKATGEIIVFADARQFFASDVLRILGTNFSDPSVGCVSGELILIEDAGSAINAEMGAYWKYEKMVRRLESTSGMVVGATGAIYAIRKTLYRPLPNGTILDDVITPMNIALQGFRVVFDDAALAYDVVSKDIEQEWTRKVRTLAGNWQLLDMARSLGNSCCLPFWWRFLSHKIFRLLVPFVLPCMLIASLVSMGILYQVALFFQLTVYLAALAGYMIPAWRKIRLVNAALFFVVMNLAAIVGCWRWASGNCEITWRPSYIK
ncbi:MAG: glycosyltransferase family 2 protein [Deltaproteobacteria bacterium]|nr:MAG: glycosyltransferase family 2 protein [Deltaproteobacteria bacterium]